MNIDFNQAQQDIQQALSGRGLILTPGALAPLSGIDFGQLQTIYDHEERFLRRVFLDSLVRAQAARTKDSSPSQDVQAEDVRVAMLMLGEAAKAAPDQDFSKQSTGILQTICPYCP